MKRSRDSRSCLVAIAALCAVSVLVACAEEGSKGSSDASPDADADADTDTDTDADSDADAGPDAGDDSCPLLTILAASQGWLENVGDYVWNFEALVTDPDGADDVVSVTVRIFDPDSESEVYALELAYNAETEIWNGLVEQTGTPLTCCDILYDVTFTALDAADCSVDESTVIVNDEP